MRLAESKIVHCVHSKEIDDETIPEQIQKSKKKLNVFRYTSKVLSRPIFFYMRQLKIV